MIFGDTRQYRQINRRFNSPNLNCDALSPDFAVFLYIYPNGCIMNEFFFNEIRNGNYNEVKAMLTKNPMLINSKDERGSTALILATYYDEQEIADLLLDMGAKIDAKDASGNTALMGVCFKGYTDVAKKLIERGANINERNAMGATCLIYAATFNREDIARLLIEHDVDTSIKDNRGLTALDHAKMQNLPAFIAMLT
jgi:ankyrin repeat protein